MGDGIESERLSLRTLNADVEPWLTRVIGLRSENLVVGLAGFHGPPGGECLREFAPGGLEFGYRVYPEWKRRGFACEASRALMAWAMRTVGTTSFVLSINADNEARGAEEVYRLSAASAS